MAEEVHHLAAGERPQIGAQPVDHGHEQPLRAGADAVIGLFLDEDSAGDIKEVERTAVDDHRQQQQNETKADRRAISQNRKRSVQAAMLISITCLMP